MSRGAWVLVWWASTLLAVVGAVRLAGAVVLLAMGQPWWTGRDLVAVAAFAVAMTGLAFYANGRRKALLLEEMPPPADVARGP